MSDKTWRLASDLEGGAESEHGRSPGKVPVTARLAARPQPVVFRVESAEAGARDANGVADGAEVAVDRASSSSGMALPGDVQGRFESSLGADLSSVRVHTGSESAAAAQAVGARAYTTGQDIHFGAGHYDPSSPFGLHLIAHEVAHTVQQQGGEPTRQNKLEVSTPGDALEVEADHAADAMVSGRAAEIASGGAAEVSRVIMRDADPTTAAMDTAGAEEVAAAREDIRVHPPAVTTINIDGGASQARRLISDIDGYDGNMNAGVTDGTNGCVTSAQYNANHQAKEQLQSYINASQDQGSTLGQFQAHAVRLRTDYAHIQGQIAGFNGSAQGAGAVTGDMGGRDAADAIVSGASGGSLESLQSAFQEANTGGNTAVSAARGNVERVRTQLQTVSRDVATKESAASAKEASARAAHAGLINAIATQSASGIEGQIAGLRSAAAAMKEKIDLAAGMVKSLVKLGGAVATGGAVGGADVANEGVAAAFSIAGYLATHQYDAQITQLNAQLRPIAATRDMSAITTAREAAVAAKREWETAGQQYVDKIHEQQRLRAELNTHLRDMGAAADRRAGGNSFAIITQILSTIDGYLAQSTTAIAIGRNEQARAGEANAAAGVVNAARPEGGRQPLTYYRPYQFYTQGAIRWGCTTMTAYLYHEGREAGNQTVAETIAEMERQAADVTTCQTRLNQVFGV